MLKKEPTVVVPRWTTVTGKKSGKGGPGTKPSEKTTGLNQSKAPFSQYGDSHQSWDEEDSGSEKLPVVEVIRSGVEAPVSGRSHPPPHSTKKRSSKKPKVKKQSFQECLAELQPDQVAEMVEEVMAKHQDTPGVLLMEVHDYLTKAFSKAEPEKDYVFSNELPGYPLCALPSQSRQSLLEAVSECPALSKEKVFRRCVEILLGAVSTGTATYGTRTMLLLLIKSDNTVCVEACNIIKLHLESNISKVPEALSLLWVGMPHPTLHPFTAARTWLVLCLPIFKQSNIPKQVFNYAVDYTILFIKYISKQNREVFLEIFSPPTFNSLICLPQLLTKKAQKNVAKMLELVQDLLEFYAEAYEEQGENERAERAVEKEGVTGSGSAEEESRWCSTCGLLTLTLSFIYLCLLALVLYYISVHGPAAALDYVENYVSAREVTVAWRYFASILADFCFVVHHYVPQWAEAFTQWANNLLLQLQSLISF